MHILERPPQENPIQEAPHALENSLKFLQRLNIELTFDLAIPFLGMYPREKKARGLSETLTLNAHGRVSLVVQWLRVHLPCKAGDSGLIPGPGR